MYSKNNKVAAETYQEMLEEDIGMPMATIYTYSQLCTLSMGERYHLVWK